MAPEIEITQDQKRMLRRELKEHSGLAGMSLTYREGRSRVDVGLFEGSPLVIVDGKKIFQKPRIITSEDGVRKLNQAGIITEAEVVKTGTDAKWAEAKKV